MREDVQLAVEILDDLGTHLVARQGGAPVERERDVPERLEEVGVIDAVEAALWRRLLAQHARG